MPTNLFESDILDPRRQFAKRQKTFRPHAEPEIVRQTFELVNLMQRWTYDIISTDRSEHEQSMSVLRSLFFTLLGPVMQRDFFFYTLSFRPRVEVIRGIFGVPPYAFLGADDAVGLNADGLSSGRSHVTYSHARGVGDAIENYMQFGVPLLVDALGREYKLKSNGSLDDVIGADLHQFADTSKDIRLVLRIKRTTRDKRIVLMQSDLGRESLRMPKPGVVLELTMSSEYEQLAKRASANQHYPIELPEIPKSQSVVVRSIRQRSANAATAELLVTLK